jgi:hypothetical protein
MGFFFEPSYHQFFLMVADLRVGFPEERGFEIKKKGDIPYYITTRIMEELKCVLNTSRLTHRLPRSREELVTVSTSWVFW